METMKKSISMPSFVRSGRPPFQPRNAAQHCHHLNPSPMKSHTSESVDRASHHPHSPKKGQKLGADPRIELGTCHKWVRSRLIIPIQETKIGLYPTEKKP